MKRETELKEGLYFVHGYYSSEWSLDSEEELRRDQMILVRDSMDDLYDIDAYDVNLREMQIGNRILEGEFVYYNGREFQTAEDNPVSVMHTELNEQLIRAIEFQNYGNQPKEVDEDVSDVFSYHINVGHGNCSIIVFGKGKSYNMWMVDCSVFDFTNKRNYSSNLDKCLQSISSNYGVGKISKLMITHLHYDHINGIEHLIKSGYIDANTEVWMNTQYPWKQPTYNRILLQLRALGVKFIDPIIDNSTKNIHILYPDVSFSKKNKAPKANINNASVLYQICFREKSMLFTGDIEKEGWENVLKCMCHLCEPIDYCLLRCHCLLKRYCIPEYYCIPHHGSITGHILSKYMSGNPCIKIFLNYVKTTKSQVLMGRNRAYKGIYSKEVLDDFENIRKTEDAQDYFRLDW